MKTYIGTKIIHAKPMDEASFLYEFKKQDKINPRTRQGYLVVYDNGYQSWSPKEVFEAAYREVSQSEKDLINNLGFNSTA